jgi:hypothetical protein
MEPSRCGRATSWTTQGGDPCRRPAAAPHSLGRVIHGASSAGGGRQFSVARPDREFEIEKEKS